MDGNDFAVRFLHDLKLEKVPAGVLRQVKICLLDLVGGCLAGSKAKGAKILFDFCNRQMTGAREATVIGTGKKLPCVGASLVNGFIANALDIDDGHRIIKGHPGAAAFPTVLAVSEKVRASGKQLLEALLVGYEIGIRAGEILHGHYGYYHGSGSWGGLASAAAASKLLRLSHTQTENALGIAEAYGPLIPEIRAVEHPAMAPKDGICWGSLVGTTAVFLAQKGYTGGPSLLGDEGRNGDVFTLGRDFKIMKLYFKPYPCCRWAQPAVDGVLRLMTEKGLTYKEISRITIKSFSEAVSLWQAAPTTLEDAEYNVLYPVAVAAVYGEFTPKYLNEKYFKDPKILKMMKKIRIVQDPKIQEQFPEKCLSELEITTNRGKRHRSGTIAARGDFDTPLSEQDLEDKFIRITSGFLSKRQMDSVIKIVKNFEHYPVKDLIRFLR
jgi:2-methylcitrate dehydratase PrpD